MAIVKVSSSRMMAVFEVNLNTLPTETVVSGAIYENQPENGRDNLLEKIRFSNEEVSNVLAAYRELPSAMLKVVKLTSIGEFC